MNRRIKLKFGWPDKTEEFKKNMGVFSTKVARINIICRRR